jgi:hypothetical protein
MVFVLFEVAVIGMGEVGVVGGISELPKVGHCTRWRSQCIVFIFFRVSV